MNDSNEQTHRFNDYNAWRNSFKTSEEAARAAFSIARRQEIELNTLRLSKVPDPCVRLTEVEEADLKHLTELMAKPQPMLLLHSGRAYNFNSELQTSAPAEPDKNE